MGLCSSKPVSLTDVTLTQEGAASQASGPRSFGGAHAGDEPVNGVAHGLERGQWLSCGEDSAVALTDWQQGSVLQTWRGHKKGVNRVLPAPRLDGAVSAGRDTLIKVWRRGQPEAVGELSGHKLSISAIALSADSATLCSGSRDSSVRVWDVASAACTATCDGEPVCRPPAASLGWLSAQLPCLHGASHALPRTPCARFDGRCSLCSRALSPRSLSERGHLHGVARRAVARAAGLRGPEAPVVGPAVRPSSALDTATARSERA
eukprot:2232905-Prymnesium_polylepis.2